MSFKIKNKLSNAWVTVYYKTLKELIHRIWCVFLHIYYLVLNELCAYLKKHDLQKEASTCGNIVSSCACPYIKYGQLFITQDKKEKKSV